MGIFNRKYLEIIEGLPVPESGLIIMTKNGIKNIGQSCPKENT